MVLGVSWADLAAAGPEEAAGRTPAGEVRSADDLLIVDCLLPAKVRRLGRRNTYLMPRRPIKTTTADCRIRGGEYTEPDQASHATALRVWLPQAKAGDQEAQFYVGQIFEKGLGVAPDYESAAVWYERAAEQGYEAAQIGLGYLYEQGLGVAQDKTVALGWYRKAAGLAEDLVIVGEADYEALVEARAGLEQKTREVEALERELGELRRQLEELESRTEGDVARRETLESVARRLRLQLEERTAEVVRGSELIATLEERLSTPAPAQAPAPVRTEIRFGSYHALVVGNSAYRQLPQLATAVNDAREIAALLEGRYGFQVRLLIDATRYQIMTALNELRESLDPEDNLLVYYAGHGLRDEAAGSAYWQPIDAEPDNPANWIPNEVVAEHLDLVPARHVFLVADSVYTGLRTRSSIARLPQGMTEEQRLHHIRLMLEKRSRLVLASGGLRPASAAGGPPRSSFSRALAEVLRENDQVLEASRVYQQLSERLAAEGEAGGQVPEFATMRWARNNVADFFFVPGS